jgi:hypothetical protein
MKIISSTDGKYIGADMAVPQVGDLVNLGDFQLAVQFVRELEDGRICLGFPNYQLVLEV